MHFRRKEILQILGISKVKAVFRKIKGQEKRYEIKIEEMKRSEEKKNTRTDVFAVILKGFAHTHIIVSNHYEITNKLQQSSKI